MKQQKAGRRARPLPCKVAVGPVLDTSYCPAILPAHHLALSPGGCLKWTGSEASIPVTSGLSHLLKTLDREGAWWGDQKGGQNESISSLRPLSLAL